MVPGAETFDSVSEFAPVVLHTARREDGVLILRNALELAQGSAAETLPGQLRRWAIETPDALFMSEPAKRGRRTLTYGDALPAVRSLSARLLKRGLSPDRPLAILAANSINHALLMLAATNVGIPVAVVSPAYASDFARPFGKLRKVFDAVRPGLVVADAAEDVARALADIDHGQRVETLQDLAWLQVGPAASDVEIAVKEALVNGDTVAKLLLTSGSTGSPKPVINTQRMMVSNMQGLALVWPFLNERPPVLVDWLPWNHTFGGNCCFNLGLYFGGAFHIDDGKPLPAFAEKTVEALKSVAPSLYFNVPAGYEALLPWLEADKAFARHFFSNLDFLFNAAAGLPASTRQRLEAVALGATGRKPRIIGAWGSTETAPFSTVVYFENEHAANLGVPMPGVEIKLLPSGGRTELRVRGPNVMPGYWNQPEATAAAFDDEGFYCIGDAGRLVDPLHPEKGILFDGRVAENFKLVSGTWVNVGALRLALIAAAKPLVSDAVIAGEGRDAIGVLVFPNEAASRAFLEETGETVAEGEHPGRHPLVIARLRQAFASHNATQGGSSTKVRVFDVLETPPSPHDDEITEKGYLNQRAILARRADRVEALYQQGERVAP